MKESNFFLNGNIITSVFLNLILAPGHHLKMVKGRVQILHSLPRKNVFDYFVTLGQNYIGVVKISRSRSKTPLTILLLGHPNVGIVTKTSLAEDGEVCILPVGSIVRVCRKGHRHPQIWISLWKKGMLQPPVILLSLSFVIRLWNFYCSSKNFCILDICV